MNRLIRPFLCLYFFFLNFLNDRQGVFVLIYHRINDDLAPNHLIISTEKFKEQMKYLQQWCEVISITRLTDLLEQIEKCRVMPTGRHRICLAGKRCGR